MDDVDVGALLRQIGRRLDWIEENLIHIGAGVGVRYLVMGSSDQRPDEVAVPPEVVELARAGKKLEAIKLYRELTGLGLDHAKAALNDLWAQPL
jgi:ribosomal protein L7/L12